MDGDACISSVIYTIYHMGSINTYIN